MAKLKVNPNPRRHIMTAAPIRRAHPPTDEEIAEVERRYEALRWRDPGRPRADLFWQAAAPLLASWDTDTPPAAA